MSTSREIVLTIAPRPSFAEHELHKATPNRECVRVARRDGWVELRDDKTAFGAAEDHRLVVTAEEFDAHLASEGRDSQFLVITHREEDGRYAFRRSGWPDVELEFTEAEVVAFRDGIAKRAFGAVACAA